MGQKAGCRVQIYKSIGNMGTFNMAAGFPTPARVYDIKHSLEIFSIFFYVSFSIPFPFILYLFYASCHVSRHFLFSDSFIVINVLFILLDFISAVFSFFVSVFCSISGDPNTFQFSFQLSDHCSFICYVIVFVFFSLLFVFSCVFSVMFSFFF